MLILTRSVGGLKDSIVIGDNIRVCVLEANDGVVRVGIDAPREINIRRAELAPLSEAEQQARAAAGR